LSRGAARDLRTRKDAELSFGEVSNLVHEALRAKLPEDERDACTGPWIREIWNEKVVYELNGKTFEATYSVSEDPQAATVSEGAEVKVAYVPTSDSAGARRVRIDFVAPIHCDRDREDGVFAELDAATGFMHVDGRISRTGVLRYRDNDGNEWGELRTEDEVFAAESMASFQRVVVTNDHPDAFVSIKNVRDVQGGHLGSAVRRDGIFVRADVTVTDPATILEIQQGKRQLSCGYTAELVEDEGEFEGEGYSFRQTNIRGNHLAIVDVGRAGPDCALISRGDGAAFSTGDAAMPAPKKKTIQQITKDAVEALQAQKSDMEGEGGVVDKITALMTLLQKALKSGDEMLMEAAWSKASELLSAAPETPAEPEPEPEPAAEEESAVDDEMAEEEEDKPDSDVTVAVDSAEAVKLRAKIDALEAERKQDAKRREDDAKAIRALARLERQALSICPDLKIDDSLSTQAATNAIMRAVVLEVSPSTKGRLDANAKQPGYLRALYDAALELHASREKHADDLSASIFEAQNSDAEDNPGAAYGDFMRRLDARSRKNTPLERKAG